MSEYFIRNINERNIKSKFWWTYYKIIFKWKLISEIWRYYLVKSRYDWKYQIWSRSGLITCVLIKKKNFRLKRCLEIIKAG